MVVLKGWRFVAFVSCIVGAIGVTIYPVIIEPMLNTEVQQKYKQMQKFSKIRREDLPPVLTKIKEE